MQPNLGVQFPTDKRQEVNQLQQLPLQKIPEKIVPEATGARHAKL